MSFGCLSVLLWIEITALVKAPKITELDRLGRKTHSCGMADKHFVLNGEPFAYKAVALNLAPSVDNNVRW